MNTPKPAVYATKEAMQYVADLDVDTDALASAANSLGYTDEQIESLTIKFDTPPVAVRSLQKFLLRRKELSMVGQLDDANNLLSIYPANIAQLSATGREPLLQTDWAFTDTGPNLLANHALANGVYLQKEYITIPELFPPEPGSQVELISRIPDFGLVSGYALGVLDAERKRIASVNSEHKRLITTQRAAAEERAKRFADSYRAVNLFAGIIQLELK